MSYTTSNPPTADNWQRVKVKGKTIDVSETNEYYFMTTIKPEVQKIAHIQTTRLDADQTRDNLYKALSTIRLKNSLETIVDARIKHATNISAQSRYITIDMIIDERVEDKSIKIVMAEFLRSIAGQDESLRNNMEKYFRRQISHHMGHTWWRFLPRILKPLIYLVEMDKLMTIKALLTSGTVEMDDYIKCFDQNGDFCYDEMPRYLDKTEMITNAYKMFFPEVCKLREGRDLLYENLIINKQHQKSFFSVINARASYWAFTMLSKLLVDATQQAPIISDIPNMLSYIDITRQFTSLRDYLNIDYIGYITNMCDVYDLQTTELGSIETFVDMDINNWTEYLSKKTPSNDIEEDVEYVQPEDTVDDILQPPRINIDETFAELSRIITEYVEQH